MAGELGLLNTYRTRVHIPLQNYRGTEDTGGKDISLEEFMQTRAINEEGKPEGLKNTRGEPITMADLWCDLGLNPSEVTLGNLITLGDEMKYLAPEMVRAMILKGLNTYDSYQMLIAGSENVSSLDVTTPWIKFNNETPVKTGEAETIAYSDVEWDRKMIRLSKDAIAIGMSDELLLSVRLPILQYYLRRVGVALAVKLFKTGVTTLINGDQADLSESAAVVGVKTANTIVFKDFKPAWIRARLIAQRWVSMLNNETEANVVLDLDEFCKPQGLGGTAVTVKSINRVIPNALDHAISSAMPDYQTMLFDQAQAMLYLLFRGLLVESERIVMREIQGTKASIIGGFATLERIARIIIDRSKEFATNGFPSWMAPLV